MSYLLYISAPRKADAVKERGQGEGRGGGGGGGLLTTSLLQRKVSETKQICSIEEFFLEFQIMVNR